MVFVVILAPFVVIAMFIAMFFCAAVPLTMMLRWASANPVKGILAGMATVAAVLLFLAVVVAQYPPQKQMLALVLWSLYIPAILSTLLAWVLLFRKEFGKAILLWVVAWLGGGLITPWIGLLDS